MTRGADPAYSNVRAAAREGSARARAHCEELWRDFSRYASKQFIAEFPYHFHRSAVEKQRACPRLGRAMPAADVRDGRSGTSERAEVVRRASAGKGKGEKEGSGFCAVRGRCADILHRGTESE